MSGHGKFNYKSLNDLKNDLQAKNVELPISNNLSVLKKPIFIGETKVPNRLAIHPMEGCDGTLDGKPDELTFRRYKRFAQGGAGLLWVEATAVSEEGRANPRQLFICEENKEAFKKMFNSMMAAARESMGDEHKPYTVLQLTHSGRYSRPTDKLEPLVAIRNPYLDKEGVISDQNIITDDMLEALEDKYVSAAIMANEIGFNAIDIKSCHRYLISELLSAYTRKGKYGGSFKNRTRFLLNIIDKINAKLGNNIDITVRLNVYDAMPYPFGWGVDKNDVNTPNLKEPMKLIGILKQKGVRCINISIGNPYYNPHVGRPYDIGSYLPPQHPVEGVGKIMNITREIQNHFPSMIFIATGFSWLRHFGANVAAGGIEKEWFKLAGFGRQAFAYPDFPMDIFRDGKMFENKVCIACSNCTTIMRDGGKTGCVPKDSEVYGPIYIEGRKGKPAINSNHISKHI